MKFIIRVVLFFILAVAAGLYLSPTSRYEHTIYHTNGVSVLKSVNPAPYDINGLYYNPKMEHFDKTPTAVGYYEVNNISTHIEPLQVNVVMVLIVCAIMTLFFAFIGLLGGPGNE